ncbi:hypothetical protein CIW49_21310 [Mycolicibacterium sp. P1-18]|nr:hypothetical protein CIW49_21310 [Mycolicibacterium sp. P1-18]
MLHRVRKPIATVAGHPWGLIAAVARTAPTTELHQYICFSRWGWSLAIGLKVYLCNRAATTSRPPTMRTG